MDTDIKIDLSESDIAVVDKFNVELNNGVSLLACRYDGNKASLDDLQNNDLETDDQYYILSSYLE